ncbi:MAG TPA: substrate-binding domain-containing protein [Thermoanaerobaculia bacterium]|jgi:Ca-activated chloride channel family protein|nr:substrate-binding domain-containing protein [Thermoanaerobaculia bacterium]
MTDPQPPKLTALGKLVILLFVAACVYGAWVLLVKKPAGAPGGGSGAAGQAAGGSGSGSAAGSSAAPSPANNGGGFLGFGGGNGPAAEIGIAYGTEKERWLQWAAARFAETADGKRIKLNLIPMGSLEGAQAVLAGDTRIHVWSPASSLYKDVFAQEWQLKHNASPFKREENLALSPMVFVMWKERYDAFLAKYHEVSFKTLGQALAEGSGWEAIAGKPEWGLFKLGHTHPNESNSGLATLVLMAYDFRGKTRGLTLADILDPGFNSWEQSFERAVSGLTNSTGNLMRDMVLRGPSAFDAVVVYESVAIDYLKNAEGRWGELRVDYPKRNLWNENPYFILDTPWSSKEQREAAAKFLDFLLTEPIQRQSLVHGFRPGNPAVPVRFAGSPFVDYQRFGLRVDLGTVCEPPPAEVINNLLAGWERAHASR